MAFLVKLWWNLKANNSLWAQFMNKKYVKHIEGNRMVGGFVLWAKIAKIQEKADLRIMWVIGEGIVSFWHDKWIFDLD